MNEIKFPVSAETFIAYHERIQKRLLTDLEQEVCAVWIPILNEAYQDGAAGTTDSILDSIANRTTAIARNASRPSLRRFLRGMLLWELRAWKQGFDEHSAKKEAQK